MGLGAHTCCAPQHVGALTYNTCETARAHSYTYTIYIYIYIYIRISVRMRILLLLSTGKNIALHVIRLYMYLLCNVFKLMCMYALTKHTQEHFCMMNNATAVSHDHIHTRIYYVDDTYTHMHMRTSA